MLRTHLTINIWLLHTDYGGVIVFRDVGGDLADWDSDRVEVFLAAQGYDLTACQYMASEAESADIYRKQRNGAWG
jgi:hypothetical protein